MHGLGINISVECTAPCVPGKSILIPAKEKKSVFINKTGIVLVYTVALYLQ